MAPGLFVKAMKSRTLFRLAWGAASRQEDQQALAHLRQLFRLNGPEEPHQGAPVEANVLYASITQRTADNLGAYESCVVALKQLEVDAAAIPSADRDFLSYHCKWVLSLTTKYQDAAAFSLARSVNVSAQTLDFPKTSRRLKRIFPMSLDHAVRLDQFFQANPG